MVGKYVLLARMAGVDCAVANTLDDAVLEARLYRPLVPLSSEQLAPDFGPIHQEMKRPGVTLMLPWEGAIAADDAAAYSYTSFSARYRAFAERPQRSMRQTHLAARSSSSTTTAIAWLSPARQQARSAVSRPSGPRSER